MSKTITTKKTLESKSKDSEIITYCHIGKVGGKRLQFYMRSHFGFSYRCVVKAIEREYSRQEMESDLRWNPYLKYIGGHDVRPHVDFGPTEERLRWFSFFRDPMSRILSHYYQQTAQQVQDGKHTLSLLEWLTRNPNRGYWQIYMIAGEKNLAKAKDIIQEKFAFVGLNEHFEQSLLMLANRFKLDNFRFIDGRSLPKPEKSEYFQQIQKEMKANQDHIRELLDEEIQFYDFVANLFDQQRESYGREKLAADLNSHFERLPAVSRYNLKNLIANSIDRLFWRPRNRFLRASHSK